MVKRNNKNIFPGIIYILAGIFGLIAEMLFIGKTVGILSFAKTESLVTVTGKIEFVTPCVNKILCFKIVEQSNSINTAIGQSSSGNVNPGSIESGQDMNKNTAGCHYEVWPCFKAPCPQVLVCPTPQTGYYIVSFPSPKKVFSLACLTNDKSKCTGIPRYINLNDYVGKEVTITGILSSHIKTPYIHVKTLNETNKCPVYSPPFCTAGEPVRQKGVDNNGCPLPLICPPAPGCLCPNGSACPNNDIGLCPEQKPPPGDWNTSCSQDTDCRLINSEQAFNCCGNNYNCQPVDYSQNKWISVNNKWYAEAVANRCATAGACPAIMCDPKPINDQYTSRCLNTSCIKVPLSDTTNRPCEINESRSCTEDLQTIVFPPTGETKIVPSSCSCGEDVKTLLYKGWKKSAQN